EEDFNEILASHFYLSSLSSDLSVAVSGADAKDNNFGFVPDLGIIRDDFVDADSNGNGVTFQGTGKTIGFWKHQNAVAIKGKGRAQVNAVDLQGYIDAIEALMLPVPFQLDDADEFQAAHDIMAKRTSDGLELLLKQLLGTEFNEVSGRGLQAPYDELQTNLIAWGEHLAANSSDFSRDDLIAAKDIFDLINNSGKN
ncbi:MAG: hypothetical protein D3910_23305, partial [Candidatus Electrothrix sp. ATG2]|nr:hypothetical protein [Candidatus Electrothrix sp. ATG2]